MAIDALSKISAVGGSDLYTAGTYSVSAGTLPAKIVALTVMEEAVVSALMEQRFSETLNKVASVAYAPKFLSQTLGALSDYFFEFPIDKIVIQSGAIILHFEKSGRHTDFTTTLANTTSTTTTLPLTTV